ncbi:hypothetical protein BSU04_09875 [Caballeronia sordidicola]|uniref:Uncharacterized protein n=1 Tax=Caballeronia sordidicola TaxID=196367 RepID=A0A226X698_CABSO|nr:hypothetical protein BSU04_09875 [Caballeronia sordidicola]
MRHRSERYARNGCHIFDRRHTWSFSLTWVLLFLIGPRNARRTALPLALRFRLPARSYRSTSACLRP